MIGNFNKKKIIILSLCAITFASIFLCYNHHLELKEIASGYLIPNGYGCEYVYYEIIREDDLEDIYSCSFDLPNYDYDFQNHSYIISFGYEIVELSYSRISKPIFHSYEYYVPKVQLLNKKDGLCHIYEVPKVNIDNDPDNYKSNVFFVEQ